MLEIVLAIVIIVVSAAFLARRFVKGLGKPCGGDCPGCAGAPSLGITPLCEADDHETGCPSPHCACALRDRDHKENP